MAGQLQRVDVQYLIAALAAGETDRVLGGVELIHVRTLQYEGLWVEALGLSERGDAASRAALALIGEAIELVKRREALDLVGYLTTPRDRVPYSAAVSEGMTCVDTYKSFVYEW